MNLSGHAPSSLYDVLGAKWIRFRSQAGVEIAVRLSLCEPGVKEGSGVIKTHTKVEPDGRALLSVYRVVGICT